MCHWVECEKKLAFWARRTQLPDPNYLGWARTRREADCTASRQQVYIYLQYCRQRDFVRFFARVRGLFSGLSDSTFALSERTASEYKEYAVDDSRRHLNCFVIRERFGYLLRQYFCQVHAEVT